MNSLFSKQFAMFLAVGTLNTIVGGILYALFIALKFNYLLATLFATCAGIVFNFFSTGKWVFSKQGGKFRSFTFVYAILYVVNVAFIKFYTVFGYDEYLSYLFSLPFVALISFVLMKNFVFKQNSKV